MVLRIEPELVLSKAPFFQHVGWLAPDAVLWGFVEPSMLSLLQLR